MKESLPAALVFRTPVNSTATASEPRNFRSEVRPGSTRRFLRYHDSTFKAVRHARRPAGTQKA